MTKLPSTSCHRLTNVPAQDLEQWQQAQRLLVHHDDEGQVRAAEAPPPARAQRRA